MIVVAAVRLLLRVRAAASSAAGCCSSWRRSSRSSASCPGVLIYTVSYQFVSRSIESWFDVKVEGALDAGLNLGRGTLDAHRHRPRHQDPRWPPSAWARRLGRGRAARARAPARAALGAGRGDRRQRRADPAHHRQHASGADARAAAAARCCARRGAQRVVSQLEGLDEDAAGGGRQRRACARWRCIPSSNFALGEQERYLLVTQPLPPGAGRQCAGGADRLPRVPAARAGARRPAQHVHRHADAGAGARGVRRGAARGRARQPAGAAAAAARRGRAPGGARRPERRSRCSPRATSSAA